MVWAPTAQLSIVTSKYKFQGWIIYISRYKKELEKVENASMGNGAHISGMNWY